MFKTITINQEMVAPSYTEFNRDYKQQVVNDEKHALNIARKLASKGLEYKQSLNLNGIYYVYFANYTLVLIPRRVRLSVYGSMISADIKWKNA
jgi:hypothetical protein